MMTNRERDRRGLTKPNDPEATRRRRSDFSPRGHGRAFSKSNVDRNDRSRHISREAINLLKGEKSSVATTAPAHERFP